MPIVSAIVELLIWSFCLTLIVALLLLLKNLPSHFRSIGSLGWPLVQGRVESVAVSTLSEQSIAELAYSYSVDGECYSGYFSRQFLDEQKAWDYASPLKGQPVFVRYKTRNPEVSALRLDDQVSAPAVCESGLFTNVLQRVISSAFGGAEWKLSAILQSRGWMVVNGKCEAVTLSQNRVRDLLYLVSYYCVVVQYSYSVNGQYFSGDTMHLFWFESSAQKFCEGLRGKDLSISYRPDAPAISKAALSARATP